MRKSIKRLELNRETLRAMTGADIDISAIGQSAALSAVEAYCCQGLSAGGSCAESICTCPGVSCPERACSGFSCTCPPNC